MSEDLSNLSNAERIEILRKMLETEQDADLAQRLKELLSLAENMRSIELKIASIDEKIEANNAVINRYWKHKYDNS